MIHQSRELELPFCILQISISQMFFKGTLVHGKVILKVGQFTISPSKCLTVMMISFPSSPVLVPNMPSQNINPVWQAELLYNHAKYLSFEPNF